MSILDTISGKIKDLENTLASHSTQVGHLTATLEKLATDKMQSMRTIDVINGAMQAYKDVVAALGGNTIPAITDVIGVVEDVVETVVDAVRGVEAANTPDGTPPVA